MKSWITFLCRHITVPCAFPPGIVFLLACPLVAAVEGSVGAVIADNYVYDVPNNGISVSAGSFNALVTRNFVNATGNIGITLGWYQQLEEMGLSIAFGLNQVRGSVYICLLLSPCTHSLYVHVS